MRWDHLVTITSFWNVAISVSGFSSHILINRNVLYDANPADLTYIRAPALKTSATPTSERAGHDETGSAHPKRPAPANRYAALDYFLGVCAEYNRKAEGSVHIVPRGSSKLPNHATVETYIYATAGDSECFVAIVHGGTRVDVKKLMAATGKEVNELQQDQTSAYCGFLSHSIPPLGHCPMVTESIGIVIDEGLLLSCQSDDLVMLGGGGHPYWQCLVNPNALLSFQNATIAPIQQEKATNDQDFLARKFFLPAPKEDDLAAPRAFDQLELPPTNVAKLLVRQRDLSNPLTPVFVTVKGCIGKVESKGKRLAQCEFLPVKDGPVNDSMLSDSRPWISGTGEKMAMSIIAGKPMIQQLGITHGEAAINLLQEGLTIQVTGRTNVGNRESLVNWVDDLKLDLLVVDYQICPDDGYLRKGVLTTPSCTKSYKHKPKVDVAVPVLPTVSLDDIFDDVVSIEIVDSIPSLEKFSHNFERLESKLDELMSNGIQPLAEAMIGIDCEWQPNQLMESGQPRPVLLMQVSLQALGIVYLFDCQTLLRPLQPPAEPTNDLENRVQEVLSELWTSTRFLKVGYQLSSDLRRLAASYPHMTCFQNVQSVLEIDNIVKRILHITKQKKSRSITMSLARMASHYLGKTVDKECQISDWMVRPLSDSQLIYSAIDAAIAPAVAEKALASIDARINEKVPIIERWEGDDDLAKAINSWRFSLLETDDPEAARKLQAKQIVGDRWIITQNWVTESDRK